MNFQTVVCTFYFFSERVSDVTAIAALKKAEDSNLLKTSKKKRKQRKENENIYEKKKETRKQFNQKKKSKFKIQNSKFFKHNIPKPQIQSQLRPKIKTKRKFSSSS